MVVTLFKEQFHNLSSMTGGITKDLSQDSQYSSCELYLGFTKQESGIETAWSLCLVGLI